jgi:hypothetical protein
MEELLLLPLIRRVEELGYYLVLMVREVYPLGAAQNCDKIRDLLVDSDMTVFFIESLGVFDKSAVQIAIQFFGVLSKQTLGEMNQRYFVI